MYTAHATKQCGITQTAPVKFHGLLCMPRALIVLPLSKVWRPMRAYLKRCLPSILLATLAPKRAQGNPFGGWMEFAWASASVASAIRQQQDMHFR